MVKSTCYVMGYHKSCFEEEKKDEPAKMAPPTKVEIRVVKDKVVELGGFHKTCLDEYQPPEGHQRPISSKTDKRVPKEKATTSCQYHKNCFDEYCSK